MGWSLTTAGRTRARMLKAAGATDAALADKLRLPRKVAAIAHNIWGAWSCRCMAVTVAWRPRGRCRADAAAFAVDPVCGAAAGRQAQAPAQRR